MPIQQHFAWLLKKFFKGAEPDINKELSGEKDSGAYIDANNMRFDVQAGQGGVLKKINGEVVTYPAIDNACTTNTHAPLSPFYKCIGVDKFFSQDDNLYHQIEFWADRKKADPALIRIDGKIVLRSINFPIDTDFPLQIDVNDSCIGGELYATDEHVPPMIFNLKDLMVNSAMLPNEDGGFICSQTYFDDFNFEDVTLELNAPVDHPVFVSLNSTPPFAADSTHFVFTGPGFNVGKVQYQIRFVTNQGDQTAWSVATPLISIPKNLSDQSSQYPYVRSFGANPGNVSPYGIWFKFRCVNLLSYDFIEIKRIRYDLGTGLGALGIEEKLDTQIDIAAGQINIINVFDNFSPGIALNDTQSSSDLSAIATAKTLRYLNQRLFLMNINYASKDLDNVVDFMQSGGETVFPVVKKIGKPGHHDPYTRTYFPSEVRGEKASYSANFFDKRGLSSFAVPLVSDYQMPNRRHAVPPGSNSELNSDGLVRAANVNGVVTNTYEVFDLVNAVAKTDNCSFKNILKDITDVLGFHVAGKGVGTLNSNVGCDPVSPSHPGAIPPLNTLYTTDSVGYQPFHPVSLADTNTISHNYRINNAVRPTSGGSGEDIPYIPKGFAPNYYSLGLGVTGVDVNSLPSWVQSFSINRSKPAGRVFAQGLGYYKLDTAVLFGANTSKLSNHIVFHSPDVAHALVDIQKVMDDVASGGTRYKLQMVSPLGFFTEVYTGALPGSGVGASNAIDLINYCRIIRENGDINPGDDHFNVGLDGGDGYGYTAYGKWRSSFQPNAGQVFTNCQGGDLLRDISSINSVVVGRQSYYEITTIGDIFNYTQVGSGQHDFSDTNIKNFHEPVYMINIIDTEADTPNTNIDSYLQTGHYQKLESIIGRKSADLVEVFPLVDERPEDCIGDDLFDNKLVFVKFNGVTSAWINVTLKSPAQKNAIYLGIQAGTLTQVFNGKTYFIKGVYRSDINNLSDTQQDAIIIFDVTLNPGTFPNSFFVPPQDSLILVRYDSSVPLKVFGGEGYINESIFSPLDYQNTSSGSLNTEFALNIGWPYRVFNVNDRVYIVRRANGPTNYIADDNEIKFFTDVSTLGGLVRQLAAMYCCESRVDLNYAFNVENPPAASSAEFFPLVHYIMRPHRWDDTSNIFTQYFSDYPGEDLLWGFGGFRVSPQINLDYSHQGESLVASGKPKIGFKENTDFCTRIIWSALRPINVTNSPGVRTFNALNFFDISDNTGEIKYAYDDRTDRNGSNLYAFTNSGVCMLMTDKRVLHELTGAQLAAMGSDETNIILEQLWMSKEIGMDDELWRSAAEYSNKIWWTNFESCYMLSDGKIEDIARESGYHSLIYNRFIKKIQPAYLDDVMAVYDTLHKEYWVGFAPHANRKVSFSNSDTLNAFKDDFVEYNCLTPFGSVLILPGTLNVGDTFSIEVALSSGQIQFTFTGLSITFFGNPGDSFLLTMIGPNQFINRRTTNKVFVYSDEKNHFIGTFDYSYDKYSCVKNVMSGLRGVQSNTLNQGFVINGSNINAFTLQGYSPDQSKAKEFIRYRGNTTTKPSRIEFYYSMDGVDAGAPVSFIDISILRDRNGWEQYISRETAGVRKRVQDRVLLVKTLHNKVEDYVMIDESLQFKDLK